MRLIDRSDTPLALGLIAGSLILFQQPLRFVLDSAREIEGGYHLDLVPTLVVLSTVFVFHQSRKRQRLQADVLAAAAEARQHMVRTQELEALVKFGRLLSSALDMQGLRYAVSRCLPEFVGERGVWVLVNRQSRWDLLAADPVTEQELSREILERLATTALASSAAADDGDGDAGVMIDSSACFPMTVGSTALGVLGVQPTGEPLDPRVRRALGVIASLLGIAVRNVQLLMETKELSVLDSLTGCLNRKPGLETLDRELQRAKRTGQPLSILMIDVDEFKGINDLYGHLCGDQVLAAIGRHFTQHLRATDVKSRYGGDEFIVILPETPLTGAEHVAASIGRAITTQAVEYQGHQLSITVSMGVACAVASDLDAKLLLDRVDRALYSAKRSGRNRSHRAQAPGGGHEAEGAAVFGQDVASVRGGFSPHLPDAATALDRRG
jgi:diguanylate cyclase (GGDEF)-like protein